MARRQARGSRRASFAQHLVIMAKSPVMGRVKQRLARDIGDVGATRFYRHSLSRAVLRLAQDPRWRTVLAIDPDRDVSAGFEPSSRIVSRVKQGGGDLGRRMQRLFALLPPGPAIIVGGDIPAICPEHIAEAFKQLGRADAVLGPALDGGYWLIGLKRNPRVLRPFADVRWSTPYALADTFANLDGKRVALAAMLGDVDTAQDLRRERAFTGRLIPPSKMPRVAHLIED